MDTEAIASEIVEIRNRLTDMDSEVEASVGTDTDDERKRLHERMRHLQDELSGTSSTHEKSPETQADQVQYIRPA